MTKTMFRRVLVGLGAFVAITIQNASAQIVPIDVRSAITDSMKMPAELKGISSPMFASLTALPGNRYVAVAAYTSLYCLDTLNSSVALVPRPSGLQGRWEPTGITFNAKGGKTYIANYHGNNILEGALDCAGGKFSVTDIISSPDTISPENVTASVDGNTLVSANYDGNTVTAFTRKDHKWASAWTAKLAQAHGVAIIGDSVYATGLERRTIDSYDLATGKPITQSGSLGPDPMQNGFMWPTGLTNYNGTLMASDAHTGYVCSLNKRTLATEVCFGGNAAGANHFNMPYGVAQLENNLLVTSTFSSRIAETKPDFKTGRVSLVRDWYWTGGRPLNMRYVTASASPRKVAFPADAYSSVCHMPDWLPDSACDYNGLAALDGAKFLRFQPSQPILATGGTPYFIGSFVGASKSDIYFFSPQEASFFNLRMIDDVPYMLVKRIGSGFFLDGTRLVSPNQTIELNAERRDFDSMIAQLSSRRLKNGIVPITDASQIMSPNGIGFAELLTASIKAAHSTVGDSFLRTYLTCSTTSCDGDALRHYATEFASQQLKQHDIALDRVIIPCMLSDAKCGHVIRQSLAKNSQLN